MSPRDSGTVRHVHDDELQLYVLGRFNAQEVEAFEGHVLDCPECSARLAAAARFVSQIIDLKRDYSHPDKRDGPRFHAADSGFLRCFSPLLADRWPVQIVDVSKNGLGLLVPVDLPLGALVQVHIGDLFALGEVRHTKQIGESQFRTGIRVEDLMRRVE